METADVVIAGAGIVGLSLALELATSGLKVTVLERATAMAESSWAAAGMLAAKDPENPPQLAPLAHYSLDLFPAFLARIEQLSGAKVPLRTRFTLQAVSAENATAAKLTPAQLHALEPELLPQGREFILLEEQSLDPRDLCATLPVAVAAAGVRICENAPVLSIDAASDAIVVQTPTGSIACTHFVNCAGAWAESPALGGLSRHHPRVAPAKGQMATLRLEPPFPPRALLTHVLRTPEIYLVPRGDGRVTVGATVEHAGFDKTVQPQAIAGLLQTAAEIWPPIRHAEILESWAGLRPYSADRLPLIGPTDPESTRPTTWVATGHFRNGILLAPGTARALALLLRGEIPEFDLAPFHPLRIYPVSDRESPVHSTAAARS